MSSKLVILSYAHFPSKPGAGFRGVHEHEVSISWTDTLANQLELRGINVAITPVGGLRNKVAFINERDAELCIEIHFNGSSNPTVSGVETLYCPKSVKGKSLAAGLHDLYAPEMHCKDRGIKEGWYRMDRPYIEDYPGDIDGDEKEDYFLKYTNCPAVILEPEFMAQIDNILKYEKEACIALAEGVHSYLEVL